LNLPYFISKRISSGEKGSFATVIHKVAVASVALGIAIMLVSFLVLGGFQNSIKDKIFTFSGHLQIKKYTFSSEYDEIPIRMTEEEKEAVMGSEYVEHLQSYALKPGLIKRNREVFGLLFKGVGLDYDTTALQDYMIQGRFPRLTTDEKFSSEVVISESMARQMQVEVGDALPTVFIMNPPRNRRLVVTGIFNSGLADFDEQVVIGDIELVRVLNNWADGFVGGYEIYLNDLSDIDAADDALLGMIATDQMTERVDNKFIQIFEWLNLLSQNVYILIGLILFVACFNMVSVLFILIMERTPMIGVFKALGAKNKLLRRIFTMNGIRLVVRGLLIGNIIALTFGFLQYQFKLIPLDAATYYMSHVPIDWNWFRILGINFLTLVIVAVVLLIPTAIISRISPVKAIRFD
jgi:lipoprotein-releasing system permease protein